MGNYSRALTILVDTLAQLTADVAADSSAAANAPCPPHNPASHRPSSPPCRGPSCVLLYVNMATVRGVE